MYESSENHLEDGCHNENEELEDEELAHHDYCNRKDKSPNVVITHVLDYSIILDVCPHVCVKRSKLTSKAFICQL